MKTNYNKYEISNKNKINEKNRIQNYQNNQKYKNLIKISSLLNLDNNLKNKNKNKRNINYYSKNILSTNSLSGFFKQNKKYQNSQKYFSSNTTNRYYKYNPEQYGSCTSLTRNYFTNISKDKKVSIKIKEKN